MSTVMIFKPKQSRYLNNQNFDMNPILIVADKYLHQFCIQIKIIQIIVQLFPLMRTRRQKAEAEAQKAERGSNSKKPTKTQLLQQKQQAVKLKKGTSVGAKKVKTSTTIVEVEKETKKNQTKTSVRAIKKQKQARVKVSPRGKSTRVTTKTSLSIDEVKVTRKSEPKEKKKAEKSVESQPVQQKQAPKRQGKHKAKQDPSPQPLPRKKPQEPKKEEEKKEKVKMTIIKGKVPIDDFFPLKKEDYHVLEMNGKVYSATLNQTNIMNNNNKFYIVQILQSDTNKNINYLFTRWGRVGFDGNNSNLGPWDSIKAIRQYESKYRDKAMKGDYREIELNYENDDEKKEEEKKKEQENNKNEEKKEKNESKLPKSVQSLIELIFDINMMNKQMVQIGYNVEKMPLGKLSKENIKRGYGILKELYDEIKTGKKRTDQIVRLTNDFFSYIPHDFGFTHMSTFILDTEQKVKQKIEMLESLTQIKVATTILSEAKSGQNKIDSNYAKLNREVQPVERSSDEFKLIDKYLQSTHGRHHTSYNLEIVDLFRVSSEMESARYRKEIHNKKLLWHGSRLTNFVGILSQGLRIAPPQAPVTGYMFGKGVYFADMSSKSANYCFTSRDNNTGIMLLCEVALGYQNPKLHADYYAANLPEGKHSTKGEGKIQPNPNNETSLEFDKDVMIPMGPAVQSGDSKYYLRYNEFIVYDIAQIKIRYLLRLKFNYNNNPVVCW